MSNARFLADIPTLAEAKGDILAATADNQWDVLSAGTDGQILTVDSNTSTGLSWTEVSVTGNIDGGLPNTIYGGVAPIDGGGVS